jgi:hypothetical protein
MAYGFRIGARLFNSLNITPENGPSVLDVQMWNPLDWIFSFDVFYQVNCIEAYVLVSFENNLL